MHTSCQRVELGKVFPKRFFPFVKKTNSLTLESVWFSRNVSHPSQEDPEIPFTEDDYRRRRSHPNYKEHISAEKTVVKLGKTVEWSMSCGSFFDGPLSTMFLAMCVLKILRWGLQYNKQTKLPQIFHWMFCCFPAAPLLPSGIAYLSDTVVRCWNVCWQEYTTIGSQAGLFLQTQFLVRPSQWFVNIGVPPLGCQVGKDVRYQSVPKAHGKFVSHIVRSLFLQNKNKLITYVVASGMTYGEGESIFHYHFKVSCHLYLACCVLSVAAYLNHDAVVVVVPLGAWEKFLE